MRILLVTPKLTIGGAERHVVELAAALKARGDEVVVASEGGVLQARLESAGVRHECLPLTARGVRNAAIALKLRRLVRRCGADVVHAHSAITAVVCRAATIGTDVPVVVTGHGWQEHEYPNVARLLRGSDAVIAVSTRMSDLLVAHGVARHRIAVVQNGISIAATQPDSGKVTAFREASACVPGTVLIGMVGRLVPEKGHPVLLEALSHLQTDVDWGVVFIGDGPDRAHLENLVAANGLARRIHFAGTVTDMPTAYAALNLVAMPSLSEGLPLALLEAMGRGLPVVASRVGGMPEVVEDGRTGLLVPSCDALALAAALSALLNDPGKRQALGRAARAAVERNHSSAAMTDRIVEVYRRVSDKSGEVTGQTAPVYVRKPTALFVVPNVSSFRTFLRPLAQEMSALGFDVHCACDTRALWAGTDAEGATIHHVAMPRGMSPRQHHAAAAALRQVVDEIHPAFVHAHFSAALFTTAIARTARWPLTLGTFHGVGFPLVAGIKGLALRAAETWAASRLDHVFVLTDDDARALGGRLSGAAVTRQPGFGIGCDTARFDGRTLSAQARAAIRSELGLAPGDFVFSFVGRFTEFKGYGNVVRAFLRLSARRPEAMKLLLVGAADGMHATGLSPNESAHLHASPHVRDIGWQDDVFKHLAVTDAFVFPSEREGMPVCVMEALSMGVPVITRDTRGCRDVVRDGVDGLVVRESTADALAQAMERLVADRRLQLRLRAGALAGRDRFSREVFVRQQIEAYTRHLASAAVASADLEVLRASHVS